MNVSAQWEQFFSLIHHYVSSAEWNCLVLSFYHFMPEGNAINTIYRLTYPPHPITTAQLHCPITIWSIHYRSSGPKPTRFHLVWQTPTSHLCHLFSLSNSHPSLSSWPFAQPCTPCPLTTPCDWRTKATSLPVPVIVKPQQLHLTEGMAKGEKDRHGPVTEFISYGTSLDEHSNCR